MSSTPIAVQCPHCQQRLSFYRTGESTLMKVTCVFCHKAFKVELAPKSPDTVHSDEAKTELRGFTPTSYSQMPTDQPVEEATELAGMTSGRQKQPYLCMDGQRIPLTIGLNSVGRKANSSRATVQLPTNDRRMSRHHAVIRVTRTPAGTLTATLSNWENANPTYIGQTRVEPHDEIVLYHGIEVRLAETIITYEEK